MDPVRKSDARVALGTVAAAVVGFAVLVLLPYAVPGFAPPPGTDVLWRAGGPLAVVLCPAAVGLAGAASTLSLLRGQRMDDTTRRLHLAAVVGALAFVAFLLSPPGQSVLDWWRD